MFCCCLCLLSTFASVSFDRSNLGISNQWFRTTAEDCVAIDTHVRGTVLYVMLVGQCQPCNDEQKVSRLQCFVNDEQSVVPSLTTSWESRGGAVHHIYGRKSNTSLAHVLLIGCSLSNAALVAGTVRIARSNGQILLPDMKWRMPVVVPMSERKELVICSRLFALERLWNPRKTAAVADWLEWHGRHGAVVHLYVYRVQIKMLWSLLESYARRGIVRVHHLPPEQKVIERLWAFGQIAYSTDCLLRYERSARYIAFTDIDEFLVPASDTTSVIQLLDARFASQPSRSVVQMVRSYLASARGCKMACENAPISTLMCLRLEKFSKDRPKWLVRTDDSQPVQLMPNVHFAQDIVGTTNEMIGGDELKLIHTRVTPIGAIDFRLSNPLVTTVHWGNCSELSAIRKSIQAHWPRYNALLRQK